MWRACASSAWLLSAVRGDSRYRQLRSIYAPGSRAMSSVFTAPEPARPRSASGRCGDIAHLEDAGPDGLLHPGIAQPEEADPVGLVGDGASLEDAPHPVHAQSVVADGQPLRRVHVDRLVLAGG